MRYTTVKVCSHPRTGSHYITALINLNFFKHADYLDLYGGHLPWGMEMKPASTLALHRKIGYIYIIRNADAVLQSIFTLRKRFGLAVEDKDEFLRRAYSRMWSPKVHAATVRTTMKESTRHTTSSKFFKDVPLRPTDYLEHHRRQWDIAAPNLLIVDYDATVTDIRPTLDSVAAFLDVPTMVEYLPVEKKVGWVAA